MNWYLSKLVYQIICGDGSHRPQFDEQLRLIHAANESEAFMRAYDYGCREADTFLNEKQHLVRWKFINVSELYKISSLIDGAELYSRIQEAENADQYIANVHGKAAHIQTGGTLQQLQLL